jgi:hypothetical protein
MEVNGQLISQSQALLRYAGKLAGLYPSDAFEALLVDEMVGAVEDVIQATVPSFREQDEAKRVGLCVVAWVCLYVFIDPVNGLHAIAYIRTQTYVSRRPCGRNWPPRPTQSGPFIRVRTSRRLLT